MREEPATTNAVEGWHAGLNKTLGRNRHFWKFLQKLDSEATANLLKISEIEMTGEIRTNRRMTRKMRRMVKILNNYHEWVQVAEKRESKLTDKQLMFFINVLVMNMST